MFFKIRVLLLAVVLSYCMLMYGLNHFHLVAALLMNLLIITDYRSQLETIKLGFNGPRVGVLYNYLLILWISQLLGNISSQ